MILSKAPECFTIPGTTRRYLKLEDFTLVESCNSEIRAEKELFLQDHVFAFVLNGTYKPQIDGEKMNIGSGECVLMRRSNMLKYQKFAAENMQGFECIFFFIKDDFIREVLQINDAVKPFPVRATSIIKLPMNEALMGYVQSIKPYFNESFMFQEALLRLKMQELLLGLIAIHHDLVPHLIDFSLPYKNDLRKVMEEHFTKNLSLEEFAYITGKSLSAFKREFQQVFNISPGKWLQKRRLDHSRKLLMHTEMNVSDVCYESGFENLSHFSRSFKSQFGINPLQVKQLS